MIDSVGVSATQITEVEQIKLSILSLLDMDVEQASLALDFIGESVLRQQLFIRFFNKTEIKNLLSERVGDSIKAAKEVLTIFE